jgi:hypothetical protein
MSTTTNFKRIALVAVAALGLGVLSSVPSNAAINADLLSVSSATASQTTAETQTATSATATLSFSGNGTAPEDSMTLTASLAEFTPATAGTLSGTNLPYLTLKETVNAIVNGGAAGLQIAPNTAAIESTTAAGSVSATYFVYIASSGTARATVAGTYKVKLTPALNNGKAAANAEAKFITITVSTAAVLDVLADATNSKVYIQKGNGNYTGATTDSAVVVAKTAASATTTQVATIYTTQKNAAAGSAQESMTVAISGPGTLAVGAAGADPASKGRSLTAIYNEVVYVFADGTAGEATITLTGATSGKVIATKKVVFYGAVASFTATASSAIVGPSATVAKAVTFLAKDSSLNTLADEASTDTWYAFSSDTSIATVPTTALTTYSLDSGTVAVTGVKAGTATITIGNASTLAASTIKSTAVSVRVGSTSVASVKVAFDKATYAPGEKAIITVSPLDATNLPVVPAETEFWATGLSVDKAFLQGSIPASDTKTTAATSTDATVPQTAGIKTYVVYMPSTPGVVKLTGTLSTAAVLAVAIQGTDVTASATVVDSGSAALAAVTALATTVASLRTLIVTLTNLVLKIQKKVKA